MGCVRVSLGALIRVRRVLVMRSWGVRVRCCAVTLGARDKILAPVKLKDLITRRHDVKGLPVLAAGRSAQGVLPLESSTAFPRCALAFIMNARRPRGIHVVGRWKALLLLLARVRVRGVLDVG